MGIDRDRQPASRSGKPVHRHMVELGVCHLVNQVAPLLKRGRYDDRTGRELTLVAAEMTQLAGWMAYDCGLHGLSRRYLVQAR